MCTMLTDFGVLGLQTTLYSLTQSFFYSGVLVFFFFYLGSVKDLKTSSPPLFLQKSAARITRGSLTCYSRLMAVTVVNSEATAVSHHLSVRNTGVSLRSSSCLSPPFSFFFFSVRGGCCLSSSRQTAPLCSLNGRRRGSAEDTSLNVICTQTIKGSCVCG